MIKWEYKTAEINVRSTVKNAKLFLDPGQLVYDHDHLAQQLNEFSDQGWQLQSAFPIIEETRGNTIVNMIFAIFKREISE